MQGILEDFFGFINERELELHPVVGVKAMH